MILPKLFLAPMADLTTPAFRRVVRTFSQNTVLYSEMISAAALVKGGMRNDYISTFHNFDTPMAFQIIGNDAEVMAKAAEILNEKNPFSIDINMGCSAPEILARNWGSALLRDKSIALNIVNKCRKRVKTLSVKMRMGFKEKDNEKLIKFAQDLQNEGVDYITIHGRSSNMAFKRSANWDIAKILKNELNIPVIGNGDICSTSDAIVRLKITDSIMIGRFAIRCPWIFSFIENALENKSENKLNEKSQKEIVITSIPKQVIDGINEFLPIELRPSRILKFCVYFCLNLKFGHQLFKEIQKCDNSDNIIQLFDEYFNRNENEKFIAKEDV